MKSFLKFLSRNKLYTSVEFLGLAVSLAFVTIIGCYGWEQYEVANEHPDRERVYVLGMPDYYGLTYGFKESVIGRIPEIEAITQISFESSCYVKCGDEDTVLASITAVDGDFFDVLSHYQIVDGSADALDKGAYVMVSESFANAHGIQTGDMLDCAGDPYTVCGIFADFRRTLLPDVDMLAPFNCDLNVNYDGEPFDHFGSHIPIVRLRKDADLDAFTDKVVTICKEIYPNIYGHSFFEYLMTTRIDKVFFDKNNDGQQFNHGDMNTLRMLILVGILLLVSAVFNYINLNTALTGKRAKEMATRRLLGATKTEIIEKYLGEAMLFTGLCFGAALLMAIAFAPVMDSLLNNPYITVKVLFTPVSVAGFLLLIVVVGILSGLIPAMLASKYKPIDVMKGSFKVANRMTFSKIFIVLQNALAVFLIAMALVMEAQYSKSLNRPKNFDTADKFYIVCGGRPAGLMERLRTLPCVENIGRTQGAPGFRTGGQYSSTRSGEEIMYRTFKMDSTAFYIFGFEKIRDYGTEPYGAIWFGERAFVASGFDDEYHDASELKQRMRNVDHTAGTIREFPVNASNIGEEDYMLVQVLSDEQMSEMYFYGMIVSTSGDKEEARQRIMEAYTEWCTDVFGIWLEPLFADFVDDNYRKALEPARNNMRLMELFMLLAVLISVLGLVAMSTYYAGENAHNIAVRKVFGGTVESETAKSVTQYMTLVAVACVLGIPVSVWAAQRYLEAYISRIENYWWIFVVAVLVSVAVAFVSVFWQVLRAARTNPATELKKE